VRPHSRHTRPLFFLTMVAALTISISRTTLASKLAGIEVYAYALLLLGICIRSEINTQGRRSHSLPARRQMTFDVSPPGVRRTDCVGNEFKPILPPTLNTARVGVIVFLHVRQIVRLVVRSCFHPDARRQPVNTVLKPGAMAQARNLHDARSEVPSSSRCSCCTAAELYKPSQLG
jgi:hypothetical protein